MGERLLCKQEVIGSNPFTSTRPPFELLDPAAGSSGRAPIVERIEITPPVKAVRRARHRRGPWPRGECPSGRRCFFIVDRFV